MIGRTSGIVFVVSVLILAGAMATTPEAKAQTRAEMTARIEQLEKQLQAVQRRVFNADSPYFEQSGSGTAPAGPVVGGAASDSDRVLLADMQVKLQQLERKMSSLTGQIEELQFQLRQQATSMERFKQDVEFRLNQLEGTGGGSPGSAGSSGSETAAMPDLGPGESALAEPASEAPAPQPILPEGTPAEQYDYAYGLLQRGDYDRAQQSFETFLERHPDDTLAGNAQYWLGETYYVRKDYARAAQSFFKGYQDYRDSSKGPDSLLKLGLTLAALEQKDEACAAFDELEIRFPAAQDRIKRRAQSERQRLGCS